MNSPKRWDLQIDPSVYRVLRKTPRLDVERLLIAIRLLPENPYFGDIQKMKGEIALGGAVLVLIAYFIGSRLLSV